METPRKAWISSDPMTYVFHKSRVSMSAMGLMSRIGLRSSAFGLRAWGLLASTIRLRPSCQDRRPEAVGPAPGSGRFQPLYERFDHRWRVSGDVRVPASGIDRNDHEFAAVRPRLGTLFLDRGRQLTGRRDDGTDDEHARIARTTRGGSRRPSPGFRDGRGIDLRHAPPEHARRVPGEQPRLRRCTRDVESVDGRLVVRTEFDFQCVTKAQNGRATHHLAGLDVLVR